MLGRKKAESAREDMWGATMIQSRFRGKMLRSRLRREKEEKAAITIEAHQRGHMARVEARALRTANADAESLRRENAAVVIQSHERGRVARAELQTLKQQRAEEDALKTEKAIVIRLISEATRRECSRLRCVGVRPSSRRTPRLRS